MSKSPGQRRPVTPGRREPHSATRSRSRLRSRSSEPDIELSRERLRMLDNEVRRERDLVRAAEDHHHASRRSDEPRADSRLRCTSASAQRRDAEPCAEQLAERGPRQHDRTERIQRSRSHSFSKRNLFDIIRNLRDGLALPVNQSAPQPQRIDHKNILPNFDPSYGRVVKKGD